MALIDRTHIDATLAAAASIWLQREQSVWMETCNSLDIARLDQQLKKHLLDLKTFGRRAVSRSLIKLEQTCNEGNIFITTYCLCCAFDAYCVRHLEALLEKFPNLLHAAGSALKWANAEQSEFLVDRWWFSGEDALRQTILPAAVVHPSIDIQQLIPRGLNDKHPGVRAQIYRAIGEWQLSDFSEGLEKAFHIETQSGLYEAAAALAMLGDNSSLHYLPYAMNEPGNDNWRRFLLIWSTIADDKQFEQWVVNGDNHFNNHTHLLMALAFRGDPHYLDKINEFLKQNDTLELATYVVQHIVGFVNSGIKNDPNKLSEWIKNNRKTLISNQRYLGGKLQDKIATEIFHAGTQPQRWQAALHLTLHGKGGAMPSLMSIAHL